MVEPHVTNMVQPDMAASLGCGDRAAHADPRSIFKPSKMTQSRIFLNHQKGSTDQYVQKNAGIRNYFLGQLISKLGASTTFPPA